MTAPRLRLAHLPTPLFHSDALDRIVGAEVWLKRDDITAGAAAGNKIRKLEYLLADALDQRATTLITCGGFQSNHCRATAILARQLGLEAVLLLRTAAPASTPPPSVGNAFLDVLVGARVRLISPVEYVRRAELMASVASELERAGERPYVIPEGGSTGLGALGYVDAMAEVEAQLRSARGVPARFDLVAHACGSGGTAAGVALGCGRFGVADRVCAFAVCDDAAYFEQVVGRIIEDARTHLDAGDWAPAPLAIEDAFKGPAYGMASPEQSRFIVRVARECGVILDPVYTGKALFGLSRMAHKPEKVLFIHTGGLPGLLAQSDELHEFL